jgi:predicted HNH restriction endonuclease
MTVRLPEERLVGSVYYDEKTLVQQVVGRKLELEPDYVTEDRPFTDAAELDFTTSEGAETLREHLLRERSTKLVSIFKSQLQNWNCTVCGFNFEKAYGEIGRDFIEAHHTKPIADMQPDEISRVSDLVPVCSNCHRILHRRHPTLSVQELRDIVAQQYIEREGNN